MTSPHYNGHHSLAKPLWPRKPQQFDREMARKWREIRREPEPLTDEFQERFLQTLLIDPEFALAVRAALHTGEGAL